MVRSLELTKQVAINNEHKFNADVLQLYFDGKGGGVEDVLLNEEEQSAVITFTEPKGISVDLCMFVNLKLFLHTLGQKV